MAGFFGLFGSKTKYIDRPTSDDERKQRESFYLSDDDAKSLGNPEYIRKSMKQKNTAAPSINGSQSTSTTTPKSNRSVDSNMDTFRKMARDLKKKS